MAHLAACRKRLNACTRLGPTNYGARANRAWPRWSARRSLTPTGNLVDVPSGPPTRPGETDPEIRAELEPLLVMNRVLRDQPGPDLLASTGQALPIPQH